jgi:hypothetical protein
VTFKLYTNNMASGMPVFEDDNEALVGGIATSKSYTTTAATTYYWVATYNGDSNNNAVSSGAADEAVTTTKASPALMTTASHAITLGTTAPTISDSAVLSGGYHETGTITFTLTGPGGFSYTQTDTVNGNGTYTAGHALPTTGTVVGTYTWSAHYSGDSNNQSASDQGTTAEQTVVSKANPKIVTTSNPTGTVNVGATALTVSDTAVVSGGYYMTGSLAFTLTGPSGFSFTKTVTLTGTGNGSYTVTTTVPTSVALGTFTWVVTYVGNANNNGANDQGGSAEQFTTLNGVVKNEAATLGFWANNNGQALLKTYGTALGNWLGTTYSNLFGNLTGATGTQIAAYYIKLKGVSGQPYQTVTDALSLALGVWVTTTGLGWNTSGNGPKHYGFTQGFQSMGLGSAVYNVGSNGASFDVQNNTYQTVNWILTHFNSHCSHTGGSYTTVPTFVLYGGNTTLINGANVVIDGINNTGDII